MAVLSPDLLRSAPLKYTQLLLIICVGLVVYTYTVRFIKARKIRRLGLEAPVIRGLVPWHLDFPIRASMHFLKNRAMDSWLDEFKKLGAEKTLNYTIELRLMADIRVIMTADCENIKAILTQQFSDYGKGRRHSEVLSST